MYPVLRIGLRSLSSAWVCSATSSTWPTVGSDPTASGCLTRLGRGSITAQLSPNIGVCNTVHQTAVSATNTTLTSYRSVTRPDHGPIPCLAYHLVPVTASHNLLVARKRAYGTLAGCALTSSGRTQLPLWTGFFPGAGGLLSHQHANQEVSLLDRRSGERAVRRRCHPSHPLTSRLCNHSTACCPNGQPFLQQWLVPTVDCLMAPCVIAGPLVQSTSSPPVT